MQLTKFGHCCLLIEEKGVRILTDPGIFSNGQNDLTNLDLILITHEHIDHCQIESLKLILQNNPTANIITNSSVAAILEKEGISSEVVEDSEVYEVKGIKVEGCGDTHATIYPTLPKIQNIGYFIADSLFYPGDVFYNPKRRVDILALPIAGPWMKMSEALDFAKELSPRICVPVHDGILSNPSWFYRNPKLILEPLGIKFLEIENNKTVQL